MDAQHYIDSFSDPSTKWWKVNTAEGATVFQTPNGGAIQLNGGDVDFYQKFDTQHDSSRMWLLSLGFTVFVENEVIVKTILAKYLHEMTTGTLQDIMAKAASMDHCAAARIRTMCVLQLRHADAEIRNMAREIAIASCEWAFQPTSLERNNHGMMLTIALLHASHVFDLPERARYESVAFEFLTSLFREVFHDNFFSNENTIGYHDFYVKSLADLNKYLAFSGQRSADDFDLFGLHRNAEEALHKVVWPDGSIPPIGESSLYRTKHKSIDGNHYFPKNGFAVMKKDNLYLSFVCGSSSETHKQMDDTSITFQVDGVDFFIDSGIYNYDYRNPLRNLVNSQRAHSGAFFAEHDALTRIEFKRAHPEYEAQLSIDADGTVVGEKKLGESRISRRVTPPEDGRFTIGDMFETDEGNAQFVQRFIVPESAQIYFKGDRITIANAGKKVDLSFSYDFTASVSKSIGEAQKGWISTALNKASAAQCLEITPESNRNILEIAITYGAENEPVSAS